MKKHRKKHCSLKRHPKSFRTDGIWEQNVQHSCDSPPSIVLQEQGSIPSRTENREQLSKKNHAKLFQRMLLCNSVGALLWTKREITEPNPEDKILKQVLERWRKRNPRWNPDMSPPELLVPYYNRVLELGTERGFKTISCPGCGRLLWSKDRILQAQL